MQRRAVATYVAIFLVIGAASYSLIATAHAPEITFPDEEPLSTGDTLTVDGRTYEVDSIEATVESSGGGGHGGGGGKTLVRSGSLVWTNESATYTETWDNGSTVTFDGDQWVVVVESGENPSQFTLREDINRQAILANDSDADNETITRDGTEYVVIDDDEGGEATLVPADEYFPEPETRQFQQGEQVQYDNHTATFSTVSNGSVVLSWTAPRTNTVELEHETRVTLNGQEYLAFFPTNNSVVLTQDFERYESEKQDIHTYHEHVNGLWGISILSSIAAMFMVMLAYLPSRY